MPDQVKILGVRVDPTSYQAVVSQVESWARRNESRYVCVANVHMVMEAHDSQIFRDIVNSADLVTPDGMPLVWLLRRWGYPQQQRVYGPDLTRHLVDMSEKAGIPVGFYGGSSETLQGLIDHLTNGHPGLNITYSYSPPFRTLTSDEDQSVIRAINAAAPKILFVGLGCPKQETWMAAHKSKIPSVMIGVGAAFDFYAGTKQQAPSWMQKLGVEWLFRLVLEPGRLWRRYLYHNPRFLAFILPQIMRGGKD